MKLFLSLLIGIFIVMGILLSLIAIYASPDEQIHFLEASYFWIADAIAILGSHLQIQSPTANEYLQ
jgi:hypothetical protein